MARLSLLLVVISAHACCAPPALLRDESPPAGSRRAAPRAGAEDDLRGVRPEVTFAAPRLCGERGVCVPVAASPRQACLASLELLEITMSWLNPSGCSPRSAPISAGQGAHRQSAAVLTVRLDDGDALVVVWGGSSGGYDRVEPLFDLLSGAALDEELEVVDARFEDIDPGGALELVLETRSEIILGSCIEPPLERRTVRRDVSFCASHGQGIFCRARLPRSFRQTERQLDRATAPVGLHQFALDIRLDGGRAEVSLASGSVPPAYEPLLGTFDLRAVPHMTSGAIVMAE